MKKEDLFPGAIVLSRISGSKKRSKHEVVEVFSTSVKLKVNGKDNSFFFASLEHIRPSKITPKSLIELGFESKVTYCNLYGAMRSEKGNFCIQYVHKGPEDIRITLKGDGSCKLWHQNAVFYDICNTSKIEKVTYIHEVQKIINKINN